VKVVEEVKVDRLLGLHEGIVALIKLMVEGLVVSVGSDCQHLSPKTVILAVGETEDVVRSYKLNESLS